MSYHFLFVGGVIDGQWKEISAADYENGLPPEKRVFATEAGITNYVRMTVLAGLNTRSFYRDVSMTPDTAVVRLFESYSAPREAKKG